MTADQEPELDLGTSDEALVVGVDQWFIPAATAQKRDQILREIDALMWSRFANALDLTANSGKLHKRIAVELAGRIRAGLHGTIPVSWLPLELRGSVATIGFAGFPREVRGVAYALAAYPEKSAGKPKQNRFRLTERRRLIYDTQPGKTVRNTWDIRDYKTWKVWCDNDENVRLAGLLLDLITLELLSSLGTPAGEKLLRDWLLNDAGD